MGNYIKHHGIKGQKWGVRRFQNKDGSLTAKGKQRYGDDEYDEERERLEQEVAARRGVKYVRKTKKEREAEDAENERKENERRSKEDAAYKRTEDKMKEVDKKLQAKYDFNSSDDIDKYYKEYDEEWFKILYEERKKEGLSHSDLSSDEFYHHGIKGQKWGRRRFQNQDGSLTAEGKKRYGTEDAFNKQYEKDVNREAGQLKIYKHQASEASKDIDNISDKMRSDRVQKMKQDAEDNIRKKVYKMSDNELREAVNRMNMEERYTQVMKDRTHIEAGKTNTEKFLDFSSAALSAAASGLTIAIMLKELQK